MTELMHLIAIEHGLWRWYTAYFEMRFVADYDPGVSDGWKTPTSDRQLANTIKASNGETVPVGFTYARTTMPAAWNKGSPGSYHMVSWEWDNTTGKSLIEYKNGEGVVSK
jgi:hypothetical protein